MSEEITKSKAKREQRKAEAAAVKRKNNLESVLGWVIGVVIALVIVAVIGMGIYQSATKTVSDNNYSECLTSEGRVKGANLSKVTDIGLDSLSVDYSTVEYTENEVQAAIDQQCENFAEFSTDTSLEVKDGDTINLDYVGYMDDVEFEGGSTQGAGTELVIGSGSYIDTFEQQLIGAHPGDAVTVNVTFPDPYESNPDYAGKAARFECTVNSIKIVPEFNDEFVKANLSDEADSAEGYRALVKELGEKGKIQNFIIGKISDEASAKAPGSYISHLKSLIKYTDEENYKYINQMYTNYYGSARYSSFSEYTGMNDADYEKDLKKNALQQASVDLTYENFFVQHGLSVSDETYNLVVSNFGGDSAVSTYGEAYLRQSAIKQTVVDYLIEHTTVNK